MTRAELDECRKRVAALEALLGNVGTDPAETKVAMYLHEDYVQSRCEVQADGIIDTVLPHVLAAANVERTADGGVVKEACDAPEEKDPAPEIEGYGDVGVGIAAHEAGQGDNDVKEKMVAPAVDGDVGGGVDDAEVIASAAHVEGEGLADSGGGGVRSDAGDGVPVEVGGKEPLVPPVMESEDAAPVQGGGVSGGVAEIGTAGDGSHGHGEVVHEMSRPGGSVQHCEAVQVSRKEPQGCCGTVIPVHNSHNPTLCFKEEERRSWTWSNSSGTSFDGGCSRVN